MICILSFAEVHLKTDGGRTITPNCKNCTINFMSVGYPSPLPAGDSSLSIQIQQRYKAVLTADVFDIGKYDIDDRWDVHTEVHYVNQFTVLINGKMELQTSDSHIKQSVCPYQLLESNMEAGDDMMFTLKSHEQSKGFNISLALSAGKNRPF